MNMIDITNFNKFELNFLLSMSAGDSTYVSEMRNMRYDVAYKIVEFTSGSVSELMKRLLKTYCF